MNTDGFDGVDRMRARGLMKRRSRLIVLVLTLDCYFVGIPGDSISKSSHEQVSQLAG
jgi:hypothetical protein